MRRIIFLLSFLFGVNSIGMHMQFLSAQQVFKEFSGIGHANNGFVRFDSIFGDYTLAGGGANIWFDRDDFHLAWRHVKGDFIVYSKVQFIGSGGDPHRKAGIMARQSLDPGSAHASAVLHGDGLTALQFREKKDSMTREIRSGEDSLVILQLERSGNLFRLSACKPGEPLREIGEIILDSFPKEVYLGLFACAHDSSSVAKAEFSNTRLVIPAPGGFRYYQEYLGSRVEILDIERGNRKMILEIPDNLEAPNWTPVGKYLLLNGRGRLYRLEIETARLELVNTGTANALNNDHGISPDGKSIVISHHVPDLPPGMNSILFTLPIEGGEPVRITEKGPSYWHGWSPDGKYLIYTAYRNGQWDIYRIPAEGGTEVELTNSPGLDDGSSYSPDGKHIWFNSNRTGVMEIWRMKADGSEQVQITNDEYQNWFPHPSPDGKQIIFLSYLPGVDAGDHPYYKQVMLRLMGSSSFTPVVIAHLYGGQGTINVPSWSPDGKKVAFVSNSGVIQ